jgi:hypothetical protein
VKLVSWRSSFSGTFDPFASRTAGSSNLIRPTRL